jgi:hypothetical protein
MQTRLRFCEFTPLDILKDNVGPKVLLPRVDQDWPVV